MCDAHELHLRPRLTRRAQSHYIDTARFQLQRALRGESSNGPGLTSAYHSQEPLQAVAQREHTTSVKCLLVQVKAARPLEGR